MINSTDQYKVDLPEMSSGDWRVERYSVSEKESTWDKLRATINGRCRYVPAGTYTRLVCRGKIIMSDTPDEIADHLPPIRRAREEDLHGLFLINGLGLGLVAKNILDSNENISVRVVEISKDVIDMVGTYYQRIYGARFEVVNADALTYKPHRHETFVGVWHDIWDSICADNLDDMKKLHRRYGTKTAWQGSWCRDECERQRKQYGYAY